MFASNFTYKLGGIGFSRLKYMMRNIESREKDGVFMAPELLDSSIPQQSYDFYSLKKADIYSLGMVVYSLITSTPRSNLDPNLSIKSSRKYELDIKRVHKINKSPVSNSLRLLVKKMIHYDPSKRPSAKLVLSEFLPSDSEIELRERNCEISTLRKRIDQMELEIHSSNVKKSPSSLRKLSY